MSPEFETRRLLTAERATFVAPSQVPQGESLEDEVFQVMFVSPKDLNQQQQSYTEAGQRDVYFDIKDVHNKMMNKYKDEVMKLNFDKKGDDIGRKFIAYFFCCI